MLKIAIGCDHIVTPFKNVLRDWLLDLGYDVIDCGTYDSERTHYPIYGKKIAELVSSGIVDRGVAICGTAVGISNAAQKYPGTRVALAGDVFTAKEARELYDANIIAFGGRIIGQGVAEDILETFLNTEYIETKQSKEDVDFINSLLTKADAQHSFKKYLDLWEEGHYHD